MDKIYGVTLKSEGKIYYFNGQDLELEKDTYAVVETEKGVQMGKIMYLADNEKVNIPVEDMKKVCIDRYVQFGAAGQADKIKPVPLSVMAKRYA
mgnify:CR=1 FL=1